jgi:hypothetical protein
MNQKNFKNQKMKFEKICKICNMDNHPTDNCFLKLKTKKIFKFQNLYENHYRIEEREKESNLEILKKSEDRKKITIVNNNNNE